MTQPTATPDPGATPNPTPSETPAATISPSKIATPSSNTPTAEELQAQLADLQKSLRDANRESAARRKQLETYEAERAERQNAELSEAEKLKKRLAEVETQKADAIAQANLRLVRAEVLAQASADFAHPDDVYTVLKDKLTVSESGEVEGLKEALAELKKSRPTWLKTYRPSGVGPTNPGEAANGSGETDAQRRARVYGQQFSPFDPAFANQKGGGEFNTDKHN